MRYGVVGSYSPTLVVLSVIIAIVASLVALALSARVTASQGRFRLAWLAGGSVAMGTGIWSMHFVGMLAFRPGIPVSHDVRLVLVSAVVPVLASLLALWVASRPRVTTGGLLAGATLMGVAIAGMHYIGIAALRVPARITWNPVLVAASVLIAVAASLAALWIALRFRRDDSGRARWIQLGSGTAMGLAIAGMHYTGMAAARFHPVGDTLGVGGHDMLHTRGLAVAVAAGTLAVLGIALLASRVDRRMRARTAETEAVRRSGDRFRSLVRASAQVVWTTDAAGGFVEEQPEWGSFTGTSWEEYRGWGWLRSFHPDDRDPLAGAWREALERVGPYEGEARVLHADGDYRALLMRAVPVREPDGRVREWVGTCTDVTERRRDERGRDLLAEAGRVLVSSLDYDETLAAVARLVVPALADWCAVDLLEGGRLRRVAVVHPDPARVELARRVEERYPSDPAAEHGVWAVVRTGQSQLVPEIPDELLERSARDAEHLRLLRELRLRAFITVPLRARGQTLGALTLVSEGSRRYGPADRDLAEELARRAAVAIDNARLYHDAEEARLQLEQQAAELEEAQAEMEMTADELQHANEELLRRTDEAERARAAADEANQAKSAFLATMSHELRTPLNAIGGYTQLLEMGIHGPLTDAQCDSLERIRRNQTHLLGLINDVLNFAKIEAGQVQFQIADVPVDETLASLDVLIEPQVRAKGLRYLLRRGDPAVTVRADRERVEQILVNLLSNAIKFTEPGGLVELSWEPGPDQVAVHVRDTGRGIPADKLGVIFEPFVQVDPTLTRNHEGTGLGLAISRDLARDMGGDLAARSRVGEGSEFTLTLRRGGPAAGAAEERPGSAAA